MAVKRGFNHIAAQIGVFALLMVLAIKQVSAEVQVPNEFSSGTPAKASEVNENFAALVEDIQAIAEPEKKYSIISSETLDSGLVRTKLYAYELGSYSGRSRFDTSNENIFLSEGDEDLENALGKFQSEWSYIADYSGASASPVAAVTMPILCPDGTVMQRSSDDSETAYNLTFRNNRGGFAFSNKGSTDAGIYFGCSSFVGDDGVTYALAEYYYLVGKGAGIYSCVEKAVWHGAFFGAPNSFWDKVYVPERTVYPNAVSGVFDRTNNGVWGTYYLEIDAPPGCLNI